MILSRFSSGFCGGSMTALAPRHERAGMYPQQQAAFEEFFRLPKNEVPSYRDVVVCTFLSRVAGYPAKLSGPCIRITHIDKLQYKFMVN